MKKRKVLVAAPSLEPYKDLFPISQYEPPVLVQSLTAARQRLSRESFSLVVVSSALKDGSGLQAANEIAGVYESYVLLFVPGDVMDQAIYQCAGHTVFVLTQPVNRPLSQQAISFLDKVYQENQSLKQQLAREKQKLRDEKMISLCKLKLIEHYHWSEEKAHAYIGKTAMDHSTTRVEVARILLGKMEARKHA